MVAQHLYWFNNFFPCFNPKAVVTLCILQCSRLFLGGMISTTLQLITTTFNVPQRVSEPPYMLIPSQNSQFVA